MLVKGDPGVSPGITRDNSVNIMYAETILNIMHAEWMEFVLHEEAIQLYAPFKRGKMTKHAHLLSFLLKQLSPLTSMADCDVVVHISRRSAR